MNKKIYILIIMILLVVGCGKKEKYVECNMGSDQSASGYKMEANYKIYYDKDIVTKIVVKQEMESSDKTILDTMKKDLVKQYKSLNNMYKGYSQDIYIKDNKLYVDVTIDYKEFDLEQFVKDNSAMKEYVNEDNKLTKDGAIKMYETTGNKCNK